MTPSVSVVIPAFNAERFIANALTSVFQQSVVPHEVIVVDDGSTDATGLVAGGFGAPVRVVRTPNRGLSEARNTGIRASTGELVALLDADDSWYPAKLELQLDAMAADTSALLCFVNTEYVRADGGVLRTGSIAGYPDLVEALLLHSCVVGPPSAALFRRAAFDRVGLFDPALSQCADWDMWIRVAARGTIATLREVLVRYLVHDANMSRDIPLLEADTLRVLGKFFSPIPRAYGHLRRRAYASQWLILAGSYHHAGRSSDAIRCALRALAAHPSSLTRLLGFGVARVARERSRTTVR